MTSAEYLRPGSFIDSDAENVVSFARAAAGGVSDERERIIRVYRAVRDEILYDPYVDYTNPIFYRASSVLEQKRGYCVSKASLLAAAARAIGTPARVGYADVKNHMSSPRLYERLKTDIYLWHSYTELLLEGRWVKATPAFNRTLCERLGVHPLEFDGRSDSLFQEYDPVGRRHMEYLQDRGSFVDVPFDTIVREFRTYYPGIMQGAIAGDFQTEAVAGDLERSQDAGKLLS
jgi:transglutaminase-like putative cysteine protease